MSDRVLVLAAALLLGGCAPVVVRAPAPPPGVAHAWVAFDVKGVRASGAVGLADRAAARKLTIRDPVRIASVSKLVVALGVMRLVEQGRLDLDADVSATLGWRVRNPRFPDTPITLRLLLSHRSSLTDDAGYVVPLGERLRDTVAKPGAFDAAHAPGSYFRYANLNFPVIASVMEAATGERFDALMQRLVTGPLGLEACFNWSRCGGDSVARAVVLYDTNGAVLRDDLRGVAPACPVVSVDAACDLAAYVPGSNGAIFSPQGGLRVSATDLSIIGRMLLARGRHRRTVFLTPASLDALTTAAWTFNGTNGDTSGGFYCSYGLATQTVPTPAAGCRDDLFTGERASGHAGDAYGVRSGLWIDRARGRGIAYFAANNGSEPPPGRTAYRAVEEWLAAKIDARIDPARR